MTNNNGTWCCSVPWQPWYTIDTCLHDIWLTSTSPTTTTVVTTATAMNVIMLVDNNNSYHHKSRVLPKVPKESSRSKSPRAKKEHSRSKSLSRRDDHHSSGFKHPLSSSTHHLSHKSQEEFEIPVIVDDITKWISGVNKNTTCRDIITVILRRNNQQFKVSPSLYN